MHAHKLDITVPSDRRLSLELPEDFPAGPAEVIVLAAPLRGRRVVRLGGTVGGSPTPSFNNNDGIAEALDQLRRDRRERIEGFDADTAAGDVHQR